MNGGIRIAAALLAALIAWPALGETIRWNLPTQNTDGSAIPATGPDALTETVIEIGTCAGTSPNWTFGTVQETLREPAPGTSKVWNPGTGTYCIRARVRTVDGEASANSALLRYVKTSPKPNAITISITATVPP